MVRKIMTTTCIGALFFNLAWVLQDPIRIVSDRILRSEIFSKAFEMLGNALHIKNASPPVDTARIVIQDYDPLPPTETTTEDYQHRIGAQKAWMRRDYRGIIDSLKKVINPNDVDWRLLAHSYYRLEEFGQALAAGEQIQKQDAPTLYALGLFAIRLSEYQRAVKHLEESVRLQPMSKTAHARLGDVYFLVGNHDKALTSWLQAKELDYNEAYLNYFIGFIYFEKKQLDKAAEYFAYLDDSESIDDWYIRAKYFRALIEESEGRRENALEILSQIQLSTIGMSEIEYDILKKKIYSHFWLGLKLFTENPRRAREHFINADASIAANPARFSGDDKIVIELLRGVLKRLEEEINGMSRHTLSSQYFRRYTDILLNDYAAGEISDGLLRVSAEVLYHCQELLLAARLFGALSKTDDIALMNHDVLQPESVQRLPNIVWSLCVDTLSPYILFNYMVVAYQKQDFTLADSLFSKTIKCIDSFKKLSNRNALLYAAHFYRSRWLENLLRDHPSRWLEEAEKIKKTLIEIKRNNPNLSLPESFYLVDGRLVILAVRAR
jgi:tetratricopeptide (TPR) repeat protein